MGQPNPWTTLVGANVDQDKATVESQKPQKSEYLTGLVVSSTQQRSAHDIQTASLRFVETYRIRDLRQCRISTKNWIVERADHSRFNQSTNHVSLEWFK